MRLLVVDHNAVLSADRGLYRALQEIPAFDVTLAVPRRWPDAYGGGRSEEEKSPLRVVPLHSIFAGRSHRAVYPGLGGLVKRLRPDILYVNAEPESYCAWQAVSVRRRVSRTTRVVVDSWRTIDYPPGGFPYRLPLVHDRAEKVVLAEADYCIVHSDTARTILQTKGFTRASVIPPPVDTERFFPGEERRLSGGFAIGFVGRLVPEKGVDDLLRALVKLPQEICLRVAGAGPSALELAGLAATLGVTDRVEWKGPLPHADVPAFLRTLDALVLPSRAGATWKEQFGRVLIEAMACGVPVLGSSSGEIPAVIGDAGVVFREGDPQNLAADLNRLYSAVDLRADLRRRGLSRVATHFALPVVARRYASLFLSLVDNPAGNE
jgi:glycosyltransferase involved in cell wall biosynthesis